MEKAPRMDLQGQVALITGAGSGIGRATAELMAAAGARVALLGHTPDELESAANRIRQNGGEALTLSADVTSSEALAASVRRIDETWNRLDILVCNAGINGKWAPVEALSEEDWDKTLGVNLRGTFLCVKHCTGMLRRRGGSITLVSSVNGTRMFSNAGASAYATSKAGQLAFGRMIALELARFSIRVNTVCPGAIATRIEENTERQDVDDLRPKVDYPEGSIPLTRGRPETARQVADAILFLSSEAASHVSGTEIFVDGGESLLEG